MDREIKEHYQVVIQAKDMAGQMGGLSGTTTVSITLLDVNDNPPRFTKSKYGPSGLQRTWSPPLLPASARQAGRQAGSPHLVSFKMNLDYCREHWVVCGPLKGRE